LPHRLSGHIGSRPVTVAPTAAGIPLSIVHVAAPAPFGGLEEVVYMLTTGLANRGHTVGLVALLGEGAVPPLVERAEAAGVPVERLTCGRNYLRERRELGRFFAASRPWLVHTHGYRSDVQAGAVAQRFSLPVMSTVHGFTGGGAKNRLYERIQRRSLRRFGGVIAVSRPLVESLVASGVARERLHLIPNAYQPGERVLSRADALAELKLSLPAGAFVIGWVGRLSREKGPDVLVDALGLLTNRNMHSVVAGDGPDRPALERRAAALGISERLHWLGVTPNISRCFSAFDCFALSSRTEGTPIALFEAIAAGVPVVASAVGGVPDVVSQGEAILVPPDDPPALARALRDVALDSPGAADRAARATARLHTERSVGPWLDEYEAVYRRLASRTAG
jgi:glycosyltransferase involved in cell wall biosynthesis